MLVLTGQEVKDPESARNKEWLEANRLGAYACQNILSESTRKEHSLLTIPFHQTKLTLVSGLMEKFQIKGRDFFANPQKDPASLIYLEKFYIEYNPNFLYNFHGTKVLKSILMASDRNALFVRYKGIEQEQDITLEIRPLLSLKDYDEPSSTEAKKYEMAKGPDYLKYTDEKEANLFLYYPGAEFRESPEHFRVDGETFFLPGTFSFTLKKDEIILFIISSDRLKDDEIKGLYEQEMKLRTDLIRDLKIKNELYKNITLSSYSYIRKKEDKHLLAESLVHPQMSFQVMINSASLLFSLRRLDLIKEILILLSRNIKKGLVPESQDSEKGQFLYTSLDNTFWYLLLLYDFIEHTADWKFIKDFLWENLRQIFHEFTNGVMGTKMDNDGLLLCPERINTGKMIEYEKGKSLGLNILWYNALKVLEMLAAKFADIELHSRTDELGFQVKKNLYMKFWNKKGQYLNNAIDRPPQNDIDDSFRPYQVFALSLPFDDLLHVKTKLILLDAVRERLLTPFGLRTLSPDSPHYLKNYSDKQPESAHNGIIHPYLLGHYITAYLKLNHYSKTARKEVKYLLLNFEKKIKEDLIGFFPQYVNSLPPYTSTGFRDYSLTLAQYVHVRDKELNSM